MPARLLLQPRGGWDRMAGAAAIGLIVLVAVVSVIAAGAAGAGPRLADVGAWLGSQGTRTVVHVNGLSGRPDGRVTLSAPAGHRIRVVQHGTSAYVVDDATGQVGRIDPARLEVAQSRSFGLGPGAQVLAGAGVAYVVDGTRGVVQRIDPTSLATLGPAVSLPAPLGSPGLDGQGTLWVPVPGDGSLVPVRAGRAGRPVRVGRPQDPLALTIAGGQPVVTDAAAATTAVIGPAGPRLTVNLPSQLASPSATALLVPPAVDGPILPVLAPASDVVVVVDTALGALSTVQLDTGADRLAAPQALGQHVYVPDETRGSVVVYDRATSQLEPPVAVTGRAGPLEAFTQGGLLWVNDETSSAAVVVEPDGSTRRVGKYDTQVPGPGTPLPAPPPARAPAPAPPVQRPTPTPAPSAPPTPVPPPGAPGTVTARPESGGIEVDFTPSSSGAPTGYALLGVAAGLSVQPALVKPTDSFAFWVTGGSCATQYSFQVAALYAGGQVASAPTLPVRPCVAPGQPEGLQVTPTTRGADVSWSPPTSTGGSQLTYTLTWRGPQPDQRSGIAGPPVSIGLSHEGTYDFVLTATNAAGSSTATLHTDLGGLPQTYQTYRNPIVNLAVRSGPGPGYQAVGLIPPGSHQAVTVLCQVWGDRATDSGDPTLTGHIWDRVSGYGPNAYVSDLYVGTPASVAGGSTGTYDVYSFPPLWECT